MKASVVIMTAILLFSPSLTFEKQINGNVLYVGGNGEGNYTSIQAAINVARDGDTIYVYPGFYNESILIDKSISLIGIVENEEKPVIHGIGDFSINVTKNDCEIKNFRILNKGIKIYSSYNIVENNAIANIQGSGIKIYSSYNTISNNTIVNASLHGIIMIKNGNSYNSITGNEITHCKRNGIGIGWGTKNIVIHNNISQNLFDGIQINFEDNSTISFNHIYKNSDGINMFGCKNITVKNNTLHDNPVAGIQMMDCYYCVVEGNEMYRNEGGIMVQSNYWGYKINKHYNLIKRNNISFNKDVGIYIEHSIMNTFTENNLINNKINAWVWYEAPFRWGDIPFRPCHNTWYANYWSDWRFHAPKPIKGIIYVQVLLFDRVIFAPPYPFPCYNFDFHPAMEPYKI